MMATLVVVQTSLFIVN